MSDINPVFTEEKARKQAKASYDMYEKTKKDTERRMKDALNPDGTKRYSKQDIADQIKLIEVAQEDAVKQYVLAGGKEEDIKKKTRKKSSDNNTTLDTIMNMMDNINEAKAEKLSATMAKVSEELEQKYIPSKGDYNPEASFDVIPIPSKGEGYKDKIAKMSVAYLTAYDENMMVSPNLYRDNLILDYILQEKLLSKEIDPMDLLEGDRNAIILFLRASGYGNEYPITATDDISGKEFDTVIDLSQLKYKDFELKGDSNGWFSYTLPVSKHEIKFRFPTHRDTLVLEQLNKTENVKLKKNSIQKAVKELDSFIETDKEIKSDQKVKVRQAIRTIEKWGEDIDDEEAPAFSNAITNRFNLLIMAVDGITDKKYIADFIKKMPVRDSYELRKYMEKNEPNVDYTITVKRPESLGGGSFTTFLQLDQFLFLNIAD